MSTRPKPQSDHTSPSREKVDVPEPPETQRLPLPTLAAMVVGSMVGAGVFALPSNFARATGVYGALIAWAIAGTGMLMLAFVFQMLAIRKPELDSGVYAYAKAGFGEYAGFFSAFGFWTSACVGNVTYWVLIKSTLGQVVPAFGAGNTIPAVIVSSVCLWAFHFLILRGVKQAAGVNKIVTVAKVVPILLFIVLAAFSVDGDVFRANLWGGGSRSAGAVFEQVRTTMLVTVFVFLGIEGASVYSRFARKRKDVGRATVLGFLGVLAMFASVTILAYGIMPKEALEEVRQPSMGGVLEAAVGTWGLVLISIGLIVSVLGAYLAWTLMAAEVLYVAARDRDMPRFLTRENKRVVPSAALFMTSALIQIFLVTSLLSDDAFTFTLKLCSALSLIPYALAAGYALQVSRRRENYTFDANRRGKEMMIAAVATFYTLFLLFAAGIKFLLLSFIIYAPGTALFAMARREQGRTVFSPGELVLFVVAVAGAGVGGGVLVRGGITI